MWKRNKKLNKKISIDNKKIIVYKFKCGGML